PRGNPILGRGLGTPAVFRRAQRYGRARSSWRASVSSCVVSRMYARTALCCAGERVSRNSAVPRSIRPKTCASSERSGAGEAPAHRRVRATLDVAGTLEPVGDGRRGTGHDTEAVCELSERQWSLPTHESQRLVVGGRQAGSASQLLVQQHDGRAEILPDSITRCAVHEMTVLSFHR